MTTLTARLQGSSKRARLIGLLLTVIVLLGSGLVVAQALWSRPPVLTAATSIGQVEPRAGAVYAVADPVSAATHERTLARLLDLNMLPESMTGSDHETELASLPQRVAAHERHLARLRELNTNGDPALDAGLTVWPARQPDQPSEPTPRLIP